jgi:hypothetical protein
MAANEILKRYNGTHHSIWWVRYNWNIYVVLSTDEGVDDVYEASTGLPIASLIKDKFETFVAENA